MAENALTAEQVKKLTKELSKITEEPFFFGRGKALGGTLTTLGYAGIAPVRLPDIPGFLDNIAEAIEDDNPVLYRFNRIGERVYARWYEMGEDGSVFTMFGNYAGPLFRTAAYVMISDTLGVETAEEQIERIREEAKREMLMRPPVTPRVPVEYYEREINKWYTEFVNKSHLCDLSHAEHIADLRRIKYQHD